MPSSRAVHFSAVLAIALAMGACAKPAAEEDAFGPGGRGLSAQGGPGSAQDFAQNVGDRVFFESDSSELTEAAQATLDKQANWLKRYGRLAFTIEGHADERGTREYNFALGARRAEAVKSYLASRLPGAQIKTTSFGKERPVAVCDDISCWSQNRRAATVLSGAGAS